ncbi:CRISPR system Cascade subunit CasA [Kribbella antiqua]|uniref:CRISPR system Cascade subunit CasA n=1 Tax=Kribbella antiqua TaxID=2512217 RepID=A0A4R2I9G8_9ACTN|nr:type I-E CRISPR-associated protein Cse1/CasA [Kribbella antiqua]TCO41064.1 CRISPR system Cascade subunit CasA [Kribbella antiqua]
MSSDNGFNLLDEPWIVALGPEGQEVELSILGVLEQAPGLITMGGEVPTQGFAITRLLLAFLHRAVDGPEDQQEWADLWHASALPIDRIRRYADQVRHRFDLFDADVPFFQVPRLRTANGEASGLEKIVADVPNGAALFTTRSAASLASISSAEAARWLVHVHAFDPSGIKSGAVGDPKVKNGKGYPIGTGWSGQIGGVLAEGNNLRETLLLNLVARDVEAYVRIGGPGDLPPWEREIDGPAGLEDRPPGGAIDLYTWQTRRVWLKGDRWGVTGVVLANGDKIQPQNRHQLDPHTAWRFSEPQTKKLKRPTYMPRGHAPERSVWRGLEALLPSLSGRRARHDEPSPFLAPGVLQWLGELSAAGILPASHVVRTRAIGAVYGTQSATYDEIVDDRLTLAIALLREDSPALGRLAEAGVEDAERTAAALWQLAENVAQAGGAAPKSGAGERAREQLYAALESPYRAWLASLDAATDTAAARAAWQSTVYGLARPIAAVVVESAGPTAWIGREIHGRLVNVAQAEAWFSARVRSILGLALGPTTNRSEEEVAS